MSLAERRWLRKVPSPGSAKAVRIAVGFAVVIGIGLVGLATRFGGPEPETAGAPAARSPEAVAAVPLDERPVEAGVVEGDPPASDVAATDALVEDASQPVGPPPGGWASPRDPSPVTPVPASERVPTPDAVRGIYVGSWSVGLASRLDRLIRLADQTEVNAFVIDVKDATGEVSYATQLPLARQIGADREIRIRDIRGVLDRLKAHDIYAIARIVVFMDPLLADARSDWAIKRTDGSLWHDAKRVHWVDSFNRDVWDYNIELAREAVALGFAEVQWDYIRFPDVPRNYLLEAVYPAREGRAMPDAIREFMQYSKERLAEFDVPVTADVFGITTSAQRDVGIGQVWEKMADVMDVLLPMVYPSHYPRGSFGIPHPNAAPYQIIKKAMDDGVARSKSIPNAAKIRPWLQAFTLGDPPYGPMHIRAQIDAVYDAGLTDWILWDPAVRYPHEAFATADGIEPWFAGTGEALYIPEPDIAVELQSEPLGAPLEIKPPKPVTGGAGG